MSNAAIALLCKASVCKQTIHTTKQLHTTLLKDGILEPFFATQIVRLYGLNGDFISARQVFDRCPQRTIFLWNSMIRAYARSHELDHAFTLTRDMLLSGARPDEFTYASLLRACSEKCEHGRTISLHCITVVSGLSTSPISASAILSAYSRIGLVHNASKILTGSMTCDTVLWNSLLLVYTRTGSWQEGLRLFHQMQTSGLQPDGYTIVEITSCICNSKLVETGRAVHGLVWRYGLNKSSHVGSALVSMYSRCNILTSACKVFEEFAEPDIILWSSLVTGCFQSGKDQQALLIFSEIMKIARVADTVLLASALAASAGVGNVKLGKEVHCYSLRAYLLWNPVVASALVAMYSKCGFIDMALVTFGMMQEQNVVSFNAILQGLGAHGRWKQAIELFEQMLLEGFEPDQSTFSALLFACYHGGVVEEGWDLFKRMGDEFGISPGTEHYVYVVKLLRMAGKLDEAYKLVSSLCSPNHGVLGALLVGNVVDEHFSIAQEEGVLMLLHMEPEKMAYRVELSNIYAAKNKWNDAGNVRDSINIVGLSKLPGLSRIVNA